MKSLTIFLLTSFIAASASAQFCTPPTPLTQKNVVGMWRGNYTLNGEIQPLQIQFREIDRQITAYLDLPDQGLQNARFDTKVCASQEIHMSKSNVGQVSLEFVGSPKGNVMSGRLSIKKGSADMGSEVFTLRKTETSVSSTDK